MRIAYINPTILIKRPVSEISSRMSERGHETTILIPRKAFHNKDESLHHSKLMMKSKLLTYPAFSPPIGSDQPIPLTLKFYKQVFYVLKNNDVVQMWVPYYFTNLFILLMKKMFFPKTKLILTMDTVPGLSFSMGKMMDSAFKIYNKVFGWLIFGTPNKITLYGRSLIHYGLKAGMPEDKIKVISTGISIPSKPKNKESKSGVVKKILFAGLLVPRKGVHKILKAMSLLKNENIILIIAGDGPEKNKLKEITKKYDLEKKVIFMGWVQDMKKMYEEADLLVLPAEGEGLPGVVMEAMSHGVPCVASNIPCIPDLIDDGINGLLFSKDDIEELAGAIRMMIKNKRMGLAAYEKIKSFDWDKIIPEYEKLYEAII